MTSEQPLKLWAKDVEDLAVIAAVAQDALVPIGEMAFLPAEKRFVLALNRFRWDRSGDAGAELGEGGPAIRQTGDAAFFDSDHRRRGFERVMSGLRFESVTAVRTKGIDLRNRDRILELLTIHPEPGAVLLVFSGTAVIRLETEELRCFLEDFGEAWPTRSVPRHPEAPTGGKK